MDIKLPIALNIVDGRILHVSERVPAGAQLVCPFCRYPAKKNAGNVRRHHYAHMPGASCSVSPETLLHEGAKYYLYYHLQKGEPVDIMVDAATLQPSKTRALLERLGVKRFSTSSNLIYRNTAATHFLERAIGDIRPDVVSCTEYSGEAIRDAFAWEIFVTHEVDGEKAMHLNSNRISYVELSPIEEGVNSYIFRLKSYGGITFMDDDRVFYDSIYRDNKAELIETFKTEMSQEVIQSKLDEARNTWENSAAKSTQRELERIVRANIDDLNPKDTVALAKAVSPSSMVIYPVNQAIGDVSNTPTPSSEWKAIETVKCEEYNKQYYVKVNDRLFFSSPMGMLQGIYEKLAMAGMLTGLTAQDTRKNETILVGAMLRLPVPGKEEVIECQSVLYRYLNLPNPDEPEPNKFLHAIM